MAGSAFAHDFTIYRGLGGNVNKTPCVTGPKTSPSEFRIDPDGLSTFQSNVALDTSKPYRVGFLVTGAPNDPPVQGDTGSVANVNGYTYTATYSPQLGGAGHWSLKNTTRTDQEMKNDFSAYAKLVGNTDRNPSYNNNPPYCPGAPMRTRFAKH
jgi:hypothetical protein